MILVFIYDVNWLTLKWLDGPLLVFNVLSFDLDVNLHGAFQDIVLFIYLH